MSSVRGQRTQIRKGRILPKNVQVSFVGTVMRPKGCNAVQRANTLSRFEAVFSGISSEPSQPLIVSLRFHNCGTVIYFSYALDWPLAEWRVWIGVAGKRPFSCLVRVTLIVHGQTRHIMILSNASLLKSAGFADSAADFVGHSFKRRQIVGTPFEPDGHAFAGKCFPNG